MEITLLWLVRVGECLGGDDGKGNGVGISSKVLTCVFRPHCADVFTAG
ncbi:hypothetical protein PDIG_38900 [Penicillium digitatum PHI26]|uniref:Uncharacterized protein n=2 Tax=Penicillium digitatum TaxID=36651 RepID=K9GJM2_PEND2|nr:hypothetical protein PDIP_85520 [Penicillium digitatum Pd1]EKV04959.1 hypothetical protein PDIP_85520 [Penicillium digitatum Pd1]EKV13391.1 hypothetical protein PDIG_38900 [Penicillium digitatum PHI26]